MLLKWDVGKEEVEWAQCQPGGQCNPGMTVLVTQKPETHLAEMQISDNPAKFQPLVEDDINQVNAGINLNAKWQSEAITAENAGERWGTHALALLSDSNVLNCL